MPGSILNTLPARDGDVLVDNAGAGKRDVLRQLPAEAAPRGKVDEFDRSGVHLVGIGIESLRRDRVQAGRQRHFGLPGAGSTIEIRGDCPDGHRYRVGIACLAGQGCGRRLHDPGVAVRHHAGHRSQDGNQREIAAGERGVVSFDSQDVASLMDPIPRQAKADRFGSACLVRGGERRMTWQVRRAWTAVQPPCRSDRR